LANHRRLAVLQTLIRKPGLSVSNLSSAVGESLTLCSQHLKHLQARGLCSATRAGRFVRYAPVADPLVPSARVLLDALTLALDGTPDAIEMAFGALTAYTHPRRLEIVALLAAEGALTPSSLQTRCSMSEAAVKRHVAKLHRRHVVGWEEHTVQLLRPKSALAKALLGLATGKKEQGR
jgi:DNA-binding transcriptional ArsR family regulator